MTRDFVVCIPTRDGTAQVLTIATMYEVASHLRRPPTFIIGKAGNVVRSRNICSEHLRQKYPGRTHAWALWLDSDILIRMEFALRLARYIEDAEKFRKSITGNYRMADGANVLMSDRSLYNAHHYTDEELLALPDGAEIAMGATGCMYLYTPLNYIWHCDQAGEDVRFWLENEDTKVYFAKNIRADHERASTLRGPETWSNDGRTEQ